MLPLKRDSKLNKDDKNVAVFILLTQPQNPSPYSIPMNNKFIRAATQINSHHLLYKCFFPQEICHLKNNNKACMSVKVEEHFGAKLCDTTD